jgi:hypothetical protein
MPQLRAVDRVGGPIVDAVADDVHFSGGLEIVAGPRFVACREVDGAVR